MIRKKVDAAAILDGIYNQIARSLGVQTTAPGMEHATKNRESVRVLVSGVQQIAV